jgi:transposase-like protein
MGLSRRQFTKEFKLAAIQRLESGARRAEVARAFEVNPSLLHRWQREFRQGPGNVFPGLGKRRWEEGQVAQLERKIGQQALEIDFLKGCLQRIDEQRKLQALAGKTLSTSRSKAPGRGCRLDGGTDVRPGGDKPVGILSLSPRPGGAGPEHETP